MAGQLAAGAFGATFAGAWAADLLLAKSAPGTPLYRRHLALFFAGAALLAAAGLATGPWPALAWAAGAAGLASGLAASVLPRLGGRRLGPLSWRRGALRRPDPARPLVLVADPHWSAGLTGLEEATARHPDADWLFLGDVFDVWVGLASMESPLQRDFLAWVGRRRTAGRWVGLWMGNREYFLDGLAERFDLLGEGTGGRLEGEDLAFEHGDWINTADWRYRLWNLASRSGPMWLLVRALPGPAARALAAGLERRLRTTNRAYKLAFPREAFEAAARAEAGLVFITGHFHTLERTAHGTALPWAHEGGFWVWRQGRLEALEPDPGGSTSSAAGAPFS